MAKKNRTTQQLRVNQTRPVSQISNTTLTHQVTQTTKTAENIYKRNGDSEKFIDKKRTNTKSDLIEITHDKLEIILLKHLEFVSIKNSWISPISVFITILLTNLTATFKKFIGIEKEVWEALFIIGLVGSFLWLVFALSIIYIHRKEANIDYVINKIKNLE